MHDPTELARLHCLLETRCYTAQTLIIGCTMRAVVSTGVVALSGALLNSAPLAQATNTAWAEPTLTSIRASTNNLPPLAQASVAPLAGTMQETLVSLANDVRSTPHGFQVAGSAPASVNQAVDQALSRWNSGMGYVVLTEEYWTSRGVTNASTVNLATAPLKEAIALVQEARNPFRPVAELQRQMVETLSRADSRVPQPELEAQARRAQGAFLRGDRTTVEQVTTEINQRINQSDAATLAKWSLGLTSLVSGAFLALLGVSKPDDVFTPEANRQFAERHLQNSKGILSRMLRTYDIHFVTRPDGYEPTIRTSGFLTATNTIFALFATMSAGNVAHWAFTRLNPESTYVPSFCIGALIGFVSLAVAEISLRRAGRQRLRATLAEFDREQAK